MATAVWEPTDATIIACKLSWIHSYYGDLWLGQPGQSVYNVKIRYEVEGSQHSQTLFLPTAVQVGDKLPVLYDRMHPDRILAANKRLKWTDKFKWIGIALGLALTALLIHIWSNGSII